jgi:c-di-GMP-binding flagellar brake protein YcgR
MSGPVSHPDRARLRLGDGHPWKRARILLRQGQRLELTLPARSSSAALAPGRSVQVLLCREDAAYLHGAEILPGSSGDRLLLLLGPAGPLRWQRREFFRMWVGFPFAIDLPGRKGGDGRRLHLFRLLDLSGGGCLCLDPGGHLRPGAPYRLHLKLPESRERMLLQGRVVRRTRVRGERAAGIEFVGLRDRDRQKILCALFGEYRRQRVRDEEASGSGPGAPPRETTCKVLERERPLF